VAGHSTESSALSERSESKGILPRSWQAQSQATEANGVLSDQSEVSKSKGTKVARGSLNPTEPSVYILRCSDGTLYVGQTNNLAARIEAHDAGTASTYKAARRPVELVYREPHASLDSAVARERQLKRWSVAKREALVAGDFLLLRQLAKRGADSH
jgi:predicted GIY-YIG superfamily endonuclease